MHLVDQQSSSFALSNAYDQATYLDCNTIDRLYTLIVSVVKFARPPGERRDGIMP
jgi:hypothetical protein